MLTVLHTYIHTYVYVCIYIHISRLLDAHQVAHCAAVSLRQAQIHSATSQCACAQISIEAFTTRQAALRSEVAMLETEHAVKFEAHEALLLEVQQECGVAEREQATFLDLLAALESIASDTVTHTPTHPRTHALTHALTPPTVFPLICCQSPIVKALPSASYRSIREHMLM